MQMADGVMENGDHGGTYSMPICCQKVSGVVFTKHGIRKSQSERWKNGLDDVCEEEESRGGYSR